MSVSLSYQTPCILRNQKFKMVINGDSYCIISVHKLTSTAIINMQCQLIFLAWEFEHDRPNLFLLPEASPSLEEL